MSTSARSELLPSRPMKEAVADIVAMSFLGLFILFVLGAFPGGNEGASGVLDFASTAGAVVVQHIGWALGVYIPILLGFYAIVIGGQLVADPTIAAQTRRTLGFAAEAMAGALVPALVLTFTACVTDPSQVGVLFVVVPVSVMMFFLAIQLGGFIVFEREIRIASAERSRDWAEQRLGLLRQRSHRPIWLVVAVHSLVSALIGMVTTLLVTSPEGSVTILTLLYGLIALGLALTSAHGVDMFHTARDRMSKAVAWTGPIGLYLVSLMLALKVLAMSGVAGGASVLTIIAFSAVSALWPRKWASQFLLNWSIQGAATRHAAKSVSAIYVRSVREIRELTGSSLLGDSSALRVKVLAVLRAFRRSSPRFDE